VRSASETIVCVVEVEDGARPPEVVLCVDAVALDEQLGDERITVRRSFQRDVVESACRQCVEGDLVSPAIRAPDRQRAFACDISIRW